MDQPSVPTIRPFDSLLGAAWRRFNTYFPTLLGISLVGLLPQVVLEFLPGAKNDQTTPAFLLAGLLSIVVAIWMSATLYDYVINRPAEKNLLALYRRARQYIWKFFTTGLLEGLIYGAITIAVILVGIFVFGLSVTDLLRNASAAAVVENIFTFFFAGLLIGLVVMIPIIFLSIRWQYASLLVITDRLANFSALQHSARLINGRWWGVFGRMFLFGICGLGYVLVTGIITSFFGDNAVAAGLQTLLVGLLTGPLFICFEVELFNDLRATIQLTSPTLPPKPIVTT